MRRKGFRNIKVKETVEFQVGYYNTNKFGKLQFSGFIDEKKDEYWFLPTHQALVDELLRIPRGSLVRATRLTAGDKHEACKYDIKVLREGFPTKEQTSLDSF